MDWPRGAFLALYVFRIPFLLLWGPGLTPGPR
jgi:hypothetical protein